MYYLCKSVSGFTTTGASILNDIEALPKGLQLWRISTAWVGGIGIVPLFSMLTDRSDKTTLSGAEISNVARESLAGAKNASFANRMLITYIALTLGNVGPGFGDVGSVSNYANFPAILKATGMIEMLIGRLEIFPALYLLRSVRND